MAVADVVAEVGDALVVMADLCLDEFTDHGHWRLKGRPDPVRVWELGGSDAPHTPPDDGGKAWRRIGRQGFALLQLAPRICRPVLQVAEVGEHQGGNVVLAGAHRDRVLNPL